MRKKVITKECPSCDDMKINEDNEFECLWGNSKISKILKDPKGRMKNCSLKRGE
jgi:hypothetical protein